MTALLHGLVVLLCSSLRVGLLYLALLKTLCNSSAASLQNHLDALACIVVGRDYEIHIVGVRVGINNSEHGDTQTVSLAHCDVLLHHVNHEEGSGQTVEVGDRTEVLLQLGTLTADLQNLALAEVAVCTVSCELVDVGHLLHCLADSGEVGEHTTGPALDYVRHVHRCCLLSHALLSLLLSSYKQNLLAALGHLLQCLSSVVDLGHSLVEVDDMNAVALHEDVGSHGGVPLSLEVTKVTASLQQCIKICSRHFCCVFDLLFTFFLILPDLVRASPLPRHSVVTGSGEWPYGLVGEPICE